MNDEVEQLKRKVKQQNILIVCLSITLACFSILMMFSFVESRTDKYGLQQMKVRIEQLKQDFHKIEEAIKLKAETENKSDSN